MVELPRRTLLAVGAVAALGAGRKPRRLRLVRDWFGADPWSPFQAWGAHS